MESESLNRKATSAILRELANQGYLSQAALERALALSGFIPTPNHWNKFINYALLILGTVFSMSGIFFFFAYNWASMSRFAKFGFIEVGLLLLVGLSTYLGVTKRSGQIALMAAAFLVGLLQAVYGQVYQTGADTYLLFVSWAILISGWVLISNYAPLWFMWLVLLNLSLAGYTTLFWEPSFQPFTALFALNAISLAIWEYAHQRKITWLMARWPIRLISCAACFTITIPTLESIFVGSAFGYRSIDHIFQLLTPLLFIGFIGAILFLYSHKINDLFILSVAACSLMVIITAIIIRIAPWSSQEFALGSTLTVGLSIVGQITLAFHWLRNISKPQEFVS